MRDYIPTEIFNRKKDALVKRTSAAGSMYIYIYCGKEM